MTSFSAIMSLDWKPAVCYVSAVILKLKQNKNAKKQILRKCRLDRSPTTLFRLFYKPVSKKFKEKSPLLLKYPLPDLSHSPIVIVS